MLELACHAWGYNNLPLKEALGTIARLGFRYVDLGTGPHLDLQRATQEPQATAERIRLLLEDYHLSLTDLYFMLPHVNSPESERRQRQLRLFENLIPFAVELGTPGITLSPGIRHQDGPEHSLARAVPAMQAMVEAAEDTDLRISFEPHLDSAAHTPEQVLLLLDAVPGLSLTLDVAHLITQQITWDDIQSLFEYTAHLQVRQAAPKKLQTPYEQGILDIEQLVYDLRQTGYQGALTVEYMITFGWHGMMEVSISQEIVKTRDAIHQARQT